MSFYNLDRECLLGVACRDFCMIAADMTMAPGMIMAKTDEDKFYLIMDNILMGAVGDSGDRAQFCNFIAHSLKLYKIRNQYPLSTSAAVEFTRNTLRNSFKNAAPCIINLLIGGYDKDHGGQLYYMDFLGSSVMLPYGAHGFGGQLAVSILESQYKHNLTESEAYAVMKLAVAEIHRRFVYSLPNFVVKLISKDGMKTMPIITPTSHN